MQFCQRHGFLRDEQAVNDPNLLFNFAIDRYTINRMLLILSAAYNIERINNLHNILTFCVSDI
jgi:hypothetical protein